MPFVAADTIDLRQIGSETFELLQDLHYVGRDDVFTVPKGFKTDLASVPPLMLFLIQRYGVHTRAALLHDWLWHLARQEKFSFTDADGIFRRALRELQVSKWKRTVMWSAVRLASIWKHDAWRDTPWKQRLGLPLLWLFEIGTMLATVVGGSYGIVWAVNALF